MLERRRATRIVLILCTLAGCAKKGPPTGGPPDIEPPRLIGSSPDSGAAGVPRNVVLSLSFSEGMEPRTTGEAISIVPPVEFRQRRWSGNTLSLVPQDSLAENRTYTVFLGAGARDRHGNPLAGAPTIVFTTADSLSPGTIEGADSPRPGRTCGAIAPDASPTARRATSTRSASPTRTACSGWWDCRFPADPGCGCSRT
jgi:hypothetical protein